MNKYSIVGTCGTRFNLYTKRSGDAASVYIIEVGHHGDEYENREVIWGSSGAVLTLEAALSDFKVGGDE